MEKDIEKSAVVKMEKTEKAVKQLTSPYKEKKETSTEFPLWLKITLPLLLLVVGNLGYQNFKMLISEQSWYRLKKVELVGVEKMDPFKLAKELGLEKGVNLLQLNEGELTEKLQMISRFSQAKVDVEFPDTIVITVKERRPEFILRYGDKISTLTSDLVPVAVEGDVVDFDLFVIEIDSTRTLKSALEHQGLINFINVFKQLPSTERDVVTMFSGIKLPSFEDEVKRPTFYYQGSQGGLKVTLSDLNLDQLRRARYAMVYVKPFIDQISRLEIRENWVVIRQKDGSLIEWNRRKELEEGQIAPTRS